MMDEPLFFFFRRTSTDCRRILQYTSVLLIKHVTISNIPLNMGSFIYCWQIAKDIVWNSVRRKCADMEQRLDVVLKMYDMQKSHALWNTQWSSRALAAKPWRFMQQIQRIVYPKMRILALTPPQFIPNLWSLIKCPSCFFSYSWWELSSIKKDEEVLFRAWQKVVHITPMCHKWLWQKRMMKEYPNTNNLH